MLDIPEKVKQLCRDDNSSLQSWRDIEAAFLIPGLIHYIRRITCTRQMIFIRRMQALRGLRSLVNR